MKVAVALLFLLFLFGCAAATEVICYWGSWSHYRTGAGKVTVDDLDPHKCSIYIYAFATLSSSTYKMEVFDPWLDISLKGYEKFVAMKQRNPALKVLIALGGWNDSLGSKYSTMLASPTLRASFVSAAVQFVQQYGFDGLDLDYEYPTAADKPHFAAWVSELRAAFQPRGLMLTAAVTPNAYKIDVGYDVPTLAAALDIINVMAYDLHGSWETNADHHAAFAARASDGGSGLDVQSVMAAWTSRGAPAAKLAMGVPLYGRTWTVSDANKTPPAPGSGAGVAGVYTAEAGLLSYHEICEHVKAGWTVVQDPSGKIGPYAYSGSQWVGYDDVTMVATKTRWAVSQGFAAVMVWDISYEDVRNGCSGGPWPLMSAIQASLGSNGTTTTTTTTTTTAATTSTTSAVTTAATTTTTSTPAAPTASAGTTARLSTTTLTPGETFTCPASEGIFPDPVDCQSYYSCGGGVAYRLTCPSGTLFDPARLYCNWLGQVSCLAPAEDSTTTTSVETTVTTPRATTTTTTGTTAKEVSTTASATTTSGTTTTTKTPAGLFTCPTPFGWHTDPADCHSYYNCFDNTPYHYTCPAGTSWQQSITNCNWSTITGC